MNPWSELVGILHIENHMKQLRTNYWKQLKLSDFGILSMMKVITGIPHSQERAKMFVFINNDRVSATENLVLLSEIIIQI